MKKTINVQTGEITTVPLTAEKIAEIEAYQRDVAPVLQMDELRRQRDQLLAETDWWVFPDSPEATAEQLAYRQALRDLPTNTTDPANPVWPTKPGGES